MNILTLCYEFPPLGGGGGKVVQGLSKNIVKLGYQVDIVTMGYKGLSNYEEHGGANIYRVPCLRASEAICHSHEMASYIAFAIPKLKKLVANKRYDLNHTHFIFPDGIIAYLLKKRFGLPYVITAHGSDVPGYNPDRFKMQHKIIAPLWKTIVQNSACIICPSRTIESLIHLQKPDATTSVIPNGMDINRLTPPQEKQKSILVVTRMFKRKGVQYCIEALKGFKHGFEVNIVGDGPYLDTLRDMAKTNGLNIKFWGWLDNDSSQLKDLFEKSSIFIFPSEAENFPIVLLEAMAAGMAIITTLGTGCSEVVGDSALLVEPRDSNGIRNALSSLVNDPNFCRSLGVSSRKRLENNFSWFSVAKRYSDLFQKYITA
jgi:glycosyltransferase involved in cell wall biosynthesis